jgi:nitroreductase
MDVWQAILDRRSVRSYLPDPVPEDVLRRLVEAGLWAPTGGNAQTWRFVVVTEAVRLNRIKMVSPGLLGNPPAVIAICQNVTESERKGAKLGKEVMTWMDTAMAAQNVMLAAHAEGLGTCPICSFHSEAVGKLLHLPDHIQPQMLISVGVPAHSPKPPKRHFDVVWFEEYT